MQTHVNCPIFRPRDTRTSENDRARALRDALRRVIVAHGALDEAQRPCGTPLPTAHAWALLELHDAGPMTVTALADRLHIDRTNVSRLCTRMEARGEVERVPHPDDGRARLVKLTAQGELLAATVDRSSTDHFTVVLGRLDGDAAGVIDALDTLRRALGDHDRKEPRP